MYVWFLHIKNPPASTGNLRDTSLIPGLGRVPGEGNGYPFQYSCLENPVEEEPGGLQSVGLQRVRHSWAHTHIFVCINMYQKFYLAHWLMREPVRCYNQFKWMWFTEIYILYQAKFSGIILVEIIYIAFPSPGHLPNPRIKPMSPTLQADSLPAEPQGSPYCYLPDKI